jgi:hypothetical protein
MEKTWLEQPRLCSVWVHRTVSGGAPNSVRCARHASDELPALGSRRRRTDINHRTSQWCTRLSGESAAEKSPLSGIKSTAYGYKSPDCPVSQRSAAQSARDAWPGQRSDGSTGLSSVHRTVSGAPTASNRQRSAAPEQERNLHRTVQCTNRQKARIVFLDCSQRLLAALGL